MNVGKRGASVSVGNKAGGFTAGSSGVSSRIRTPIKGLSLRRKLFGCTVPIAAIILIACAALVSIAAFAA